MKNKAENNNKEKEFDTVKFFRAVKDKIAKETQGMTFTEFKEYIAKRKLKIAR
jgi:hypothetical protein